MASTLYENVENWHTSAESRDLLSSDESEPFSFKEDVKDNYDGYEDVSSKHHSLKEINEKNSHGENATAKENGHDYDRINGNTINGNGVHEKHGEDACNDYDGNEEDEEDDIVDDQDNGEDDDSDKASTETKEDESAPQVPYYGRTLVAPEYMNLQLPEEISQKEEETTEDNDDNEIAVADESEDPDPSENNHVEENHDEDLRAGEDNSGPTIQKEVLEEDDITLSEEESDEDDNGVEEDERAIRADCQIKEEDKKEEEEDEGEEDGTEEDEGEEDEEREEDGQEDTAGEDYKLNSEVEHESSPQLAQEEDEDEEQNEEDGLEEDNEGDGVKEDSSLKEDGDFEETESKEEGTHAIQNEPSPQLAKADDEDDDHDEEIDNEDIETKKESTLKHSDSLKVHVASPTRDIAEVGSAAESFDDGEGVVIEDDEGDKADQEQYLNKTDEEDENRRTFNGPVEEYDSQQNKDVEAEEEMVQGDESCQSEDTEEESGDETAAIVCAPDEDETKEEHTGDDAKAEGSLDLGTIPEGEDAESDREDQDEEYSVHTSLQGHDDGSDLTGRVKELGRMFEGGGPVFPKTVKNDTDEVDGTPVSVRRYKAIFEQDRLATERAREPGRREELTGPPRGIVKNLRGLFENPQGFEARKG